MTESSSRPWLLARPEVSDTEAERIAREVFGVDGSAEEIGSQQDRNFRVTAPTGGSILLKIDNPATTRAEVELQRRIGQRLSENGVPTPTVLSAVSGESHPSIRIGETQTIARAFAFLDARSLADDDRVTGALAHRLGELAAASVQALSDLPVDDAERPIQWELRRAEQVVRSLLEYLPEERRDACIDAVERSAARLALVADDLPLQVIHGDLTSDNILAGDAGRLWVVDLGDAGVSWRIAELAVTAADVLGRTGSLADVGRVVAGFTGRVQADDAELAALWPLIVLRGAVLAVSGWSQLEVDPENEYARERLEHEWQVFARAADIDASHAEAQVRLGSGRSHRAGVPYVPVTQSVPTVVDLSIESPVLDRGSWCAADAEAAIVSAMPDDTVVARFGEARLTRVSRDVAQPGAARARCVQLWGLAETPIFAPYAGEVTVQGGDVTLDDLGVRLRFAGLVPEVSSGAVAAGQRIGRLPADSARPSVLITRQIGHAAPEAPFGAFDAAYEVDGAADPSVILGVTAAIDPDVRLLHARARRDRAMGGASERYYDEPPQIERGWGVRLIETRGRAYLDMVNNVTAIGHSHPRLADAVSRQLNLLNTNSRFLYDAYADFTEKLLAHSPDPSLDTVIPVNSGSEALDLAIHLARVATGRRDIVAAREGYHGWTMAADSVSTSAFDNPNALHSRPEWVHIVDAPNPYRGVHRGEGAAAAYLADAREALDRLASQGRPPAAFLCEPVLGNAGGVVPPEGYLPGMYEAVRAHGGLAIADEVQVGYGRLGGAFWGSTLMGAVPDIIAVAKAAGNAYPVGAVITRREIVDALRREGMFFSSAGGAPASAVAGAAVLDVIRDEGLQENARRVGGYLREQLIALEGRHPLIGAVHGAGLYLGVELVRDRDELTPAAEETRWVCDRLLELGVVMQATSERQNVLKVKPPLTLTREDADAFVAALDRALSDVIAIKP